MFQVRLETKGLYSLIYIIEKIGSECSVILRPEGIVLSVRAANNVSVWASALLTDLGMLQPTDETVYFEVNLKGLSKILGSISANTTEMVLFVFEDEIEVKGEKTTDTGHKIFFEHKTPVRTLLQSEKCLLREPETSMPEVNVFVEPFHEILSFVGKIEKISNAVQLSFVKRGELYTLELEGSYQTIHPKATFSGLRSCGEEINKSCLVVVKAKKLLNALQCNDLIPNNVVFSAVNRGFLAVYVHFAEEGTLSYFIPSLVESL